MRDNSVVPAAADSVVGGLPFVATHFCGFCIIQANNRTKTRRLHDTIPPSSLLRTTVSRRGEFACHVDNARKTGSDKRDAQPVDFERIFCIKDSFPFAASVPYAFLSKLGDRPSQNLARRLK